MSVCVCNIYACIYAAIVSPLHMYMLNMQYPESIAAS